MKTLWPGLVIVLLALLALVVGIPAAQQQPDKSPGFFSPLKKGQPVSVKEVAGGYQITISPDLPPNNKVTEVGPDYFAFTDVTGLTETRIPIQSVRTIKVIRLNNPE